MDRSIPYPDFSNNFVVHIRSIEKDHTDETGTYNYSVGFNVLCTTNRRVMYFEDHLNVSSLPTSYTEQDIVDAAWSDIKPNIKDWATTVITLPSLLGSTWVPPTDLSFSAIGNFTIDTYNSNFTTKISRFEVYPQTNPNSWCIGFTITNNNGNNLNGSLYIDTNIIVNTFAITKTEEEILELGWSNIKEQIGKWAEEKYASSHLINSVYKTSLNNW